MPELPEIETLRHDLAPTLTGQTLKKVCAYRSGLREPFPLPLLRLKEMSILGVERRSKYLRLKLVSGSILVHLGMSGQLRRVKSTTPLEKHDHLDMVLSDGWTLRLRDPRRFGAVLWEPEGTVHPRLAALGPEPLEKTFTGPYLHRMLAKRRGPLKVALMDSSVVVGVGNIYATEALFDAKLSPQRPANTVTPKEAERLVKSTKKALENGIRLGGSSMRDYVHADGSLGGFLGQAQVYGKAGQSCPQCQKPLISTRLGGRASVWCNHCQK